MDTAETVYISSLALLKVTHTHTHTHTHYFIHLLFPITIVIELCNISLALSPSLSADVEARPCGRANGGDGSNVGRVC